jgi:hypothetical protein
MRLSRVFPVFGRRTVVALGVAGMLMMASAAQAQDPAPAQAAAAAPDPFKFDGSHPVMLMMSIKPGQEAVFEEAFDAVRKGLAASDKPELQAQAKSMVLLRLTSEMPPTMNRPFVVYLDPPVANASYNFTKMIYESGAWKADDVEVRKIIDPIYEKFVASVAEQGIWPMVKK